MAKTFPNEFPYLIRDIIEYQTGRKIQTRPPDMEGNSTFIIDCHDNRDLELSGVLDYKITITANVNPAGDYDRIAAIKIATELVNLICRIEKCEPESFQGGA